MAQILGVDISHWQANVDFEKLKANAVRFAIFKAGEIPTSNKLEFTDDKYGRNISEAARVGIISGAYYFFHPAIGGKRQARHFDAVMDKYGYPDLPPVIDVEVNDNREPGVVASVLKEMIDDLQNRGYRTPIIYSRWGFLVNQAGEPYWLKNHLLWLAQYNRQLVNKPADMSKVIIWQFTENLRLPGVGLDLDGNYWLKTEEELVALVKPRRPAVTTPPVEETQPATSESVEQAQESENETDVIAEVKPEVQTEEVEEEVDELIIPTQPALESETQPAQVQEPIVVDLSEMSAEQTQTLPPAEPEAVNRNTAGAGVNMWEMIVKLIREIINSWQKK